MSERIEAIKARLAKATPGEWRLAHTSDRMVYADSEEYGWVCDCADEVDAEFIANAPEDIAYLLADNARLRQALEEIAKNQRWKGEGMPSFQIRLLGKVAENALIGGDAA